MRKLILVMFCSLFVALQFGACGSDGNGPNDILSISPEGPTTVKLGTTLSFDANLAVTWSVAGGAARGTIDADGLYTPPSNIPVDSPVVTILAETADGQGAEAFVDLRAADTLTLSAVEPVNDTPIPFTLIIGSILLGPQADRLSVRTGSIQVDSVWANDDSGVGVFFSQNLDFTGFSPERNITPTSVEQFPLSLEADAEMNPILTFIDLDSGTPRLKFLRSNDGGANFGTPVDIAPAVPTNSQLGGNLRLDAQGNLHIVYQETDESVIDGATNIFYSQSVDGGGTWSAPEPVTNSPDNTEPNTFPFLAVNPDGEGIVICWSRSTPDEIFVSQSQNGGESFSAPSPLTTDGENSFCRAAIGPGGEVYITYSHGLGASESDVLLRKSTDGGQSFGAAIPVNSAETNVSESLILISVDDLGRVDVAWNTEPETDTSAVLHARSLDGGASFTEGAPLAEVAGASQAVLPNGLRHDAAGRLHFQYLQINDNIDFQVLYRYGQ